MSDSTPAAAAIVLTSNNFPDTDECLDSLSRVAFPNLRVYLVDNGSDDGSGSELLEKWGEKCVYLRLERNVGVAAGYNSGIAAALEAGAEYVLLLNNDVVVDPDLLSVMLPAFEAFPRLGTLSPIITYYDDPDRIWFAGGRYGRLLGVSRHYLLDKPLAAADARYGRLYETGYVPTCVSLTPKRVSETVGLLDERFFVGLDDVDWAIRLKAAGFKIMVTGRPLARHKVSVSAGERGSNVLTPLQAYHRAKGSMLIAAKWAKGWRRLPYLAGELLIRLPFYAAQMLMRRRPQGVIAYMRGMRDGARDYLRNAA